MTNLKLPTIAREVRLGFRKDSDLNQTFNQPRVNTALDLIGCMRSVSIPGSNSKLRQLPMQLGMSRTLPLFSRE